MSSERIKTTLAYIVRDGLWLMLLRNRKKNDLNEGKWVGIGGKFEPGEGPDECMKREIFEETGLTVTAFDFLGVVDFSSDRWAPEAMYLYRVTDFSGELRADCPEGELRWIPGEELAELPMWEGDRYFLEPLLRGEKDFDMSLSYEGEKLVKVERFDT